MDFPSITVPAGTILYSGSTDKTSRCPLVYKYRGQNGRIGPLMYLTSDETAAEGYALCQRGTTGWVKRYKVAADLELADVSADQLHYEWDEVLDSFCKGGNGYYLNWGNAVEYAICQPSKFLKLVEAKRCIGNGKFTAYTCKLVNGRRTRKKGI